MRFGFFIIVAVGLVSGCAEQHTPPHPEGAPRETTGTAALERSDLDTANRDFRAWVSTYQSSAAANRPAQLEQGLALANARRAAMRDLLLGDPARALPLAFTPPERNALPPAIRERVERWRDGLGTLRVIGATPSLNGPTRDPVERFVTFDDAENTFLRAGVSGRRLEQSTQHSLRLHGVVLDGVIGLTESPLRRRFEGEQFDLPTDPPSLCPTSRNLVASTLVFHEGEKAVAFCMAAHATAEEFRLIERERDQGAPASSWTVGPKTILFMRVDFSDRAGEPISAGAAEDLINNRTNSFYVANSFNQTSMSVVNTPVLRMPQPAAFYDSTDNYLQLMFDASVVSKAAGFDPVNYSIKVVASAGIFNHGWAGRASVGAPEMWINGEFTLRVVGHELGHNYGVYHANYWSAGQSIIGNGNLIEYGNPFDMMSTSGNSDKHFNVWFKRLFDWVPSTETQVVTSSGTYRIGALESPVPQGQFHAIKVSRPGDSAQRAYWLEFRQAFGSSNTATDGALFNWGFPFSGAQGSQLLDMTPYNGASDAALVIGRTFSDPLAGLHFTPVGKGGTTPESLDLVVNVGAFTNNRAPTASLGASATTVANGSSVTFTVTAADPDGDPLAYAWDFDDGTTGPNASSAMKTLPNDRVSNVRCTVSDMKGGLAIAQISVTTGTATGFTLSGRVTTGAGTPVPGVRINDGTRATESASDGSWALSNVPLGTYTINADKYDWVFTRGFAQSLLVSGALTGLDFSAAVRSSYRIRGTVFDSGNPLNGVTVSNGSVSVVTDSTGAYILDNLPNGRYPLTASKEGYRIGLPFGLTNPVEINGADLVVNFNTSGEAVAGSIPADGGITSAPVVTDGLRSTTCIMRGGGEGNPEGGASGWGYTLYPVPAGSYTLRAVSPGVTLVPANFTNPVTVPEGGRMNVDFALAAANTHAVFGTITTGGLGLPSVTVSDGTRTATTDDRGRYAIDGVPDGTYTLTPTKLGFTFVPASKSVAVAGSDVSAQDFTTTVVNLPPTIAVPPSSNPPSTTGGTSVQLSVLGADDNGEPGLTYTWAETGPLQNPVFTANATNAAKNTTATFTFAGQYTFEVTVTDPAGLSVRAGVAVTVTATPSGMAVTPNNANVLLGQSRVFTGVLKDQFGNGIGGAGQPTYAVPAAAGTIDSNGRFTAAMTPGGPYTLTAQLAGRSATASVLVVGPGSPVITSVAKANPSPVPGTTTSLSVSATDDLGEAGLTYAWSKIAGPRPVTFTPNTSNAAKSATATFDRVGEYDLLVTVTDADLNAATSAVHVEVTPTHTSIALEPQTAMVQVGTTLQLVATVKDQFGAPVSPQPAVVFSVSGGGTIDAAGLFAAGLTPGGPHTAQARFGLVSGSSTLTVSMTPDTSPPLVSLTAPAAGSRLEGTRQLTATASDNVGVINVSFYVDATKVGEDTSAPYEVSVDFGAVSNGPHVLTAKATDAAGNTTTSDGVNVVVGAAPTDAAPPAVSITAPSAASLTSLGVAVVVNASDDVGVTKVQLELDGAIVRELTLAPWSATIDVAEGAHRLVAVAFDAAGKSTRSTAVAFTASSGMTMPPGDADAGLGPDANGLAPVVNKCGCGTAGGAPWLVALLAVVRRRRRAK